MREVILDVIFGGEEVFVYFDPPCIPEVGEHILCTSTRDGNGNYDPQGEVVRRAVGRVLERKFRFAQRGKSPSDYHNMMYITIHATIEEGGHETT